MSATADDLRYLARVLNRGVVSAELVFGWWLVECNGHQAYWVHAKSGVILASARNRNTRRESAEPDQCNCSGSWHAIGSQGCTMEAVSTR